LNLSPVSGDEKQMVRSEGLLQCFGRSHSGDVVVDRFTDIEATIEAGLFGGYTWVGPKDPRQRISTSLQVLQDAAGEHEGFLITGSVRYFQPVAKPLTLSVGFSATYGSTDYMQTYFGVDAVNAARSGLSRFDADAGFRDMRFPIMAIFSFSPKWHLAGGVIFSRLLEDASESPVTVPGVWYSNFPFSVLR
jgi:outer membrane protein